METELPDNVFKYAETGFEQGGQFKPHKTHRNGLSVDFMVPVVDEKGLSVHLPTLPLNRFGYDIEFNAQGEFGELTIDYEAMGLHLVSLHKETKRRGYDIWRVIFDPQLQPYLFKTKHGEYLRQNIQFSKKFLGYVMMSIIMSTSKYRASHSASRLINRAFFSAWFLAVSPLLRPLHSITSLLHGRKVLLNDNDAIHRRMFRR